MKHTKHFIAAFCILPSSFFFLFSFFLGLGIWNLGLGTCFAQPAYTWANSIGTTSGDLGQGIAVDGSGNVYITGYFSGTADFDPSGGTANLISAGGTDIFVAKYTSAGVYLWAFNIGGASDDWGYSIAVDGSGNVYITGIFQGTADFDPSGITNNLTSAGAGDIFVAKYNSAGDYQWAFKIGGPDVALYESGNDIAVDGSGNVYVTGKFYGGPIDFDPSGTTNNLTSGGGFDIFAAKYTSAGIYQWAFNVSGTGSDFGKSIAVDGSGNVLITGWFNNTADFDPSGSTANLTPVGGPIDIFVAKYTSAGAYLWAFNIGSASNDYGYGIDVDGSGNVLVTGGFGNVFGGTADFDPSGITNNLTSAGAGDIFVAKYNSAGAYLWAFNLGSTWADYGYDITVDGSGNVLVTGYFQLTVDFDPSGSTVNLTSAGSDDIFVAKYTSAGTYLCAGRMGGTTGDNGYGITVDGSGNAFVTGSFASAPADFDPGTGTANLSSAGSNDIFFAKYSQCSGFTATQFCVAVGGAGSDGGNSIVQTSDGGYAVAGHTTSFGQGLDDVYVVKLDGSGTVQWTRTIGSSVSDKGFSIIQTSDGGYAVAGNYNYQIFPVLPPELYVVKLDGSGAVQWTRTVGGASNDWGFSIVQTSDDGYAVTGQTLSYGAGGSDVYVVKLDASGTLLWTRTVGMNGNEEGYSIVQTSDGGLAVAGLGQSGPFDFFLYVVKLDASGTLQWTRTVSIGAINTANGPSIVQTSDDGLAVTAVAPYGGSRDVYIVKLNSSGTVLWTRTVGGVGIDEGHSIVQTSDGGLAVAGTTNSYGAGSNDVYVVKLDASGTVLWTRTFGGAGDDRGYSIVQTPDGGFVVAGQTNSFGSGSDDVYIIKIAP